MAKNKTLEIKPDEMCFELQVGLQHGENILKEVYIKEITGNEEELISKPEMRTNYGKAITALLANTITKFSDGENITITKQQFTPSKWEDVMRKLYLGDRDLALLKLREFTYGNELLVDTKCPNCNDTLKVTFFIEEIPVKNIAVTPDRIPFELPKGYRDKEGTLYRNGFMRLPNGGDQEALDPIVKRNPGMANTALISRCVTDFDGLKLTPSIFKDMSQKDREYLIKLISESAFGPNFVVSVPCDNCAFEFEVGVNPVNFI